MQQLNLKKRSYFPSLVFEFDLPEAHKLNDQLLKTIYAERDHDQEGIERSNFRKLGGWHSKTNLHKSADFAGLVDIITSVTKKMSEDLGYDKTYSLQIGTMWSIINPPGSSNLSHIHPGCIWSGVYYVQAPENSGKISFTDPRTANLMIKPKYIPNQKRPRQCWTKVNYKPIPGRMIIFPSWLYHSVAPNLSEEEGKMGERVIISFNLSQRKN